MSEQKYRKLGPVTAYAIAVEHGFAGTEEAWLASLHPTDGQVARYFAENPAQRVQDGSVSLDKLADDVTDRLTGLDRRMDTIQQNQTSPYNFRGAVADLTALAAVTDPARNDTYFVEDLQCRYTWTGSDWQKSSLDESGYADQLAGLRRDLEGSVAAAMDGQTPVLFGLHDGWIGGDGVYHPPHEGDNEKYTDQISVTAGENFNVEVTLAAEHAMWVGYSEYDQNGVFLQRVLLVNGITQQTYSGTVSIQDGVSSVVFLFKEWDGAEFRLTKDWDIGGLLADGSVSADKLADGSVTLSKLSSDMKERTRNLFDSPWEQARYDDNGVFTPSTTDKTRAATRPDTQVTGGETYTISFGDHAYSGVSRFYVMQFDAQKSRLKYESFFYSVGKRTFTLEANTAYLGFMVYSTGSTPDRYEDLIPAWTQVEEGDAATAFIAPVVLDSRLIDGEGLAEGPMKEPIARAAADAVLSCLPSGTVRTVAHRGDDIEGPQCTAPAYILARRRGISVAENDLALSEDGEFVMWHDTTLALLGNLTDLNGYGMYTDGTGYFWVDPADSAVYTWDGTAYVPSSVPIGNLTRCAGANYGVNSTSGVTGLNLDVLRRIDFGAYKGQRFAGTRILTFEEWVLLCKQLGMEIYVDKKLTYTEELLARVANVVKGCGMASHTSWLGVGGVADIRFLRTILPDARVGVLSHPTAALIETYGPVNTGRGFFFNGDAKNGMTRQAVRLGLEAGFDVEVWFVDVPASYTEEQILETIRTATSYGVTAMSLDHYRVEDAFLPWLEAYG